MHLDIIYVVFIIGILLVSWICRFISFPNLGRFRPLFLQVLFKLSPFLFPFWESSNMNARSFVIFSQISEAVFMYFHSLSPSCSYCVIYYILFSHSPIPFFVPVHFLLVPFMEVLKIIIINNNHLIIIAFSLKLSIWYYWISFISLPIIFNFCCLKYLHNCSLKHFYHDYFNFLASLSSQVLHILIVLFHFLIWFKISLVLDMTNDFNLNLDIFMLCHADTGSYLKLLL